MRGRVSGGPETIYPEENRSDGCDQDKTEDDAPSGPSGVSLAAEGGAAERRHPRVHHARVPSDGAAVPRAAGTVRARNIRLTRATIAVPARAPTRSEKGGPTSHDRLLRVHFIYRRGGHEKEATDDEGAAFLCDHKGIPKNPETVPVGCSGIFSRLL